MRVPFISRKSDELANPRETASEVSAFETAPVSMHHSSLLERQG
jgi:hypothetical protein